MEQINKLREALDGLSKWTMNLAIMSDVIKAREALNELEKLRKEALERKALYERRDRAMQEKFEFRLVWYPHAKPYVELWRKGGRLGSYTGETVLEALEYAVNATGVQ